MANLFATVMAPEFSDGGAMFPDGGGGGGGGAGGYIFLRNEDSDRIVLFEI